MAFEGDNIFEQFIRMGIVRCRKLEYLHIGCIGDMGHLLSILRHIDTNADLQQSLSFIMLKTTRKNRDDELFRLISAKFLSNQKSKKIICCSKSERVS